MSTKRLISYLLLPTILFWFLPGLLCASPKKLAPKEPAAPTQVTDIRFWSNPDYTRVAISLEKDITWERQELMRPSPGGGKIGRIVLDLHNTRLSSSVKDITIGDGLLKGVRIAQNRAGVVRVVLDTETYRSYTVFPLSNPSRLIIDVRGDHRAELRSAEPELTSPTHERSSLKPVAPTLSLPAITRGERPAKPLTIAKIRRIVIDAGHGGHDPGAVGQTGLQEKDIVLQLALKLRNAVRETLGLDVVMTRASDVFIPLEERTAIANKVNADLFVSIHANAAPNRAASGIETYYLNLAKTEKVAQLAAKENGTSLEKVSTLQAILFDLMANYKLNDSAHLAEDIQRSLVKSVRSSFPDTRNLGVKQGPFYVLVGASMPSILAEVAFISNTVEEQRLQDPVFQNLLVEGLLNGITAYAQSVH